MRTADILNGHVDLDVQCLDRIYLNGYVPNLQVGGQVVAFLAARGFPIPSPAVVGRIGDRFRASVRSFAEANQIPMIKFVKGVRKIETMTPYLARQARTGRSGVAAIGWAQEFQWVSTCTITEARNGGAPHFGWGRLLRPLMAADQPPAPIEVRQALRTLDRAVTDYIDNARIAA